MLGFAILFSAVAPEVRFVADDLSFLLEDCVDGAMLIDSAIRKVGGRLSDKEALRKAKLEEIIARREALASAPVPGDVEVLQMVAAAASASFCTGLTATTSGMCGMLVP